MIEKYTVNKVLKTYQCDRHGFMRPTVLMNELQGIADDHAEILGAGRTFCIEHNIAWVVTHYLVDIVESPREMEEIAIISWPAKHDALRATREFEIRGADNRLLVRATSQWILIDMKTRRPMRLDQNLPKWDFDSNRAYDMPFEKFPDFVPDNESKKFFSIRYDDFDVNQHVNNAVYALWATESIGFDLRDKYKLRQISLHFKKEISINTQEIEVDSIFDGNISRHWIKSQNTNHSDIVCEWEVI